MGIISSNSAELDSHLTQILSEIEMNVNFTLADLDKFMDFLLKYKGKTSKVLNKVDQERKIKIGKRILELMTIYSDLTDPINIKDKEFIEKVFPDEKVRAESAYVYFSSCIRFLLEFDMGQSLTWPHYSFQYQNTWIGNRVKNENYWFRIKHGVDAYYDE